MTDIIACPGCRRKLRLPEAQRGQEVLCPYCQTRFHAVPELLDQAPIPPTEETASAPSPQPGESIPSSGVPVPLRIIRAHPSRRFLVLLAAAMVGGGVLMYCLNRHPPSEKSAPSAETREEPERAQVLDAFKRQKPITGPELAQEVSLFFVELSQALAAGDPDPITAHINLDRAVDQQRTNGLPLTSSRRPILRQRIRQSFLTFLEHRRWDRSDFLQLRKLPFGNEAEILARHRDGASIVHHLRWWVTREKGIWQVYDVEDLAEGLPLGLIGCPGDLRTHLGIEGQQLHLAHQALERRGDVDAAERLLQKLAGMDRQQPLYPVRCLILGRIHLHRRQYNEAVTVFEQGMQRPRPVPYLKLLAGIAHNHLGQWGKALPHLEAFRDQLGEDGPVCRELGLALCGLRRFEEGARQSRKALDFAPTDARAFECLMHCLGPDDNPDELADRFARLGDHARHYPAFAEELRQQRDGPALNALARAMQKIAPDLAAADFHRALAQAWMGHADEAVKLFQAALDKEKYAARQREYLSVFLQVMAQAGLAAEALAVAPDPGEAFHYLAAELLKRFDSTPALRRLIAVYARKRPEDPLLPFYRGEVHVRDENYREADRAFQAGIAHPPDRSTLGSFRASRVLARFHNGQARAAFREIEPRADTFTQLAALCVRDNRLDDLRALLDAHARISPKDVQLLRYRCRLKIRAGKTDEALPLLTALLARPARAALREALLMEFLSDMTEAGKLVEGYQAVPDGKLAFRLLAADLLDESRLRELRRLVEAHRQRHPQDYELKYYAGQLLLADRAWDQAARVLAEGRKKAPAADAATQLRFRFVYLLAMARAGRALEAYRAEAFDGDAFSTLARRLTADRKWADLEALVAERHRHGAADSELLFRDALVCIHRQAGAGADALIRQACAQPPPWRYREYVSTYAQEMKNIGKWQEGYRQAPDHPIAFEVLAQALLAEKRIDDLEQLFAKHARKHDGDPWLSFYQGEESLRRGQNERAQEHFTTAYRRAPAALKTRFRQGLFRARIQAGRTAATYEEFGSEGATFESLAALCVSEKRPDQLEALLRVHRKHQPDDPFTAAWEIDLAWLRGQTALVVEKLTRDATGLFQRPRLRWKRSSYLVRGLVKLGRAAEAVRVAEATGAQQYGDRLLLVLAQAATGNVQQTIAVMEKVSRESYFATSCYQDPDLGPLLRSASFKPFRAQFPEPREEERR